MFRYPQLFWSVLCIALVTGLCSHDHHSLLMTHSQGLLQSYNLQKRQAGLWFGDSEQCDQIRLQNGCTNGLFQDLVNLANQCRTSLSLSFVSTTYQNICKINSMGRYCGAYVATLYPQFVEGVCYSATTNCSSDCRELLITTRDRVGCCINAINDISLSSPLLADSLWSSCGLEPVTEECSPSTITVPDVRLDSTCTTANFEHRFYSTLCKGRYFYPVPEMCQDDLGFEGTCKINEFGQFCLESSLDLDGHLKRILCMPKHG